ncbi:MAG: TonB-dependent receptor [Gemmatimonadota bacterium]|nr:TonB-dependent receptor [Gemmatimonadota bacterium]
MSSTHVRDTRKHPFRPRRSYGVVGTIAAVAAMLVTVPAAAQTGQVTGTVTNAASGAVVSEAQVYLVGEDLGALSRSDGRFLLLNVPAGTHELRAERIGFASTTETITVTAGETTTVDFALASEALGLDEIVVTGTAGASRRREIGNTISQVNADDIPDAPVQVSDMLQGSAPGLDIYGGGAAGQGKTVRLRGTNSALLNERPIVYIDGVRIRSQRIPDANPPDRRGGRSGNTSADPLDQINPNDIERIEVIKGSAATTLYGTEAAGGVIQVFTKQGTGGAPQWTAEVGGGTEWSRAFGVDGSGVPHNNMEHWLCTGVFECGQFANQSYAQDYSLSVRGGAGGVNYMISGSFSDAQGFITNDTQQRYTATSNLNFSPADGLQIQWNTTYGNRLLTMTAQQNNAQGITLNAFRAERNYFGTGDPEVLNELMEQDINEDIERLTTGATITYSPVSDLTNRFTVGYDWTAREHRNLRPYAWEQVPEGALLNNTFQNRVLSLDYVGTYSFSITDAIGSSFSWGGQAVGNDERLLEGFGENFPGAANPTLNSAATVQSFEERSKIWNAGFFFQNVFDVADKYFITAGLRVDGNSAFGEGFGLQVYPKVSGSWIVSDEDFYPDVGEFKLRAAFGQSGRAPGPFDQVRTWSPEGLAGNPAFVPENVGNPDIGPEVTTEFEGGFDATWFNDRLSTSFTYYKQVTEEALFNVPQLPSSGFSSSQLTNIGELENDGLEVQVDATVLQTADWTVDLGLNVSTNEGIITALDDPSLETSDRRVGYPIRAVTNEKIANPNEPANSLDDVRFLQPEDAEWQGTGTQPNQYLYGSNLPKTFIDPSITVRTPGGVTLAARGAYRGGFYMNESVFSIGRSVRSPLCFPYYQNPEESIDLQSDIPALWYARCNPADTEGYVWDASYFKLRSVSASIPMDFAFPERVNSSVLTLALNNSYLWMKEMPFMDPETASDPSGGAQQGYDFEETVPPPISLRISLRITF